MLLICAHHWILTVILSDSAGFRATALHAFPPQTSLVTALLMQLICNQPKSIIIYSTKQSPR